MEQHFKKIFSVFTAILIGMGIVLFAWKGVNAPYVKDTTIKNDAEWRNSLSVVPQPTQIKTLGATKNTLAISDTEATTTTDLVARKLLLEYTATQKGSATSTISDVDAKNIAYRLAQEVKLPQKKEYILSDLSVFSENTTATYNTYSENLSAILNNHMATEKTENELGIVNSVMNGGGEASLLKLRAKILNYEQLLKKLLALKTPSSLAPMHLHLIQTYETLRVATVGLQKILVDPIIGIASIEEYRRGIDALFTTSQEFTDFFATH